MPLDTWASKSKICLSKGLNSSCPLLSLALVMLKLYSMTIRAIVIHGDPVLHNPTEPVTEPIDYPELQTLIAEDRKSTRLNSSYVASSYTDFCLNKQTRLGILSFS